MNLKFHTATLDDLELLQAFEQVLLSQVKQIEPSINQSGPLNYHDLPKLIQEENTKILIASVGGNPVGCGLAKIQDNRSLYTHTQYGDIGFMYVKDEFQKMGIGRAIIDELKKWLKQQGIKEAQLSVYTNNEAIGFYETCGFRPFMCQMKMEI